MEGIRVGPTTALMPHPGAYPPPMMQGYGKRMRLPATPAQIAQSCMRQRMPNLLPVPANFQAFPGDMGPPQHPQGLTGGLPSPGVVFTQEDVDMVLYGYARIRGNRQIPGHALSGLRIGELSYGIDRILAGCSAIKHPAAPVHVDPATLDVPEGK
ncbi:hypothetical protein NP493_12g06025 [Ridgeia piscesae]|uniref:Uncharacterized protein n=1 Tax=Ridgeia piscesae TaxID=27915 RepID=A0AAD9ULB7_RIDPI|nr:hypothetical protein NP493_12g06025 [Ridgeia piscesae]